MIKHKFALNLLKALAILLIICPKLIIAAEHPSIMVSIKPFYNLCARVMQGVGKPELLLKNDASPHDFHLKPSDLKLIESTDLIIWGGPELEGFLQKPIANATVKHDLNLAAVPKLKLLPLRTSTNWEDHDHNHGHDHNHDHNHEHNHSHSLIDSHFWLDPDNAVILAQAIAQRLAELDPAHAKVYLQNAIDFKQEIKAKIPAWRKNLVLMKEKPFIVFHDAYQYFDLYFKLNGVGAISLNPEIPPSAQRIQQIDQLLKQEKVVCIFSEPQFNPKIIETLVNGMHIYQGVLDPLGQDADIGPNGYFVLLDKLVESFVACSHN